jgi:hypothetical protein
MKYLSKMKAIEKHAGNAQRAAALAGVTPTTWSRWSNRKVNPNGINGDTRSMTIIDLLYEKISSSHPPPSGP